MSSEIAIFVYRSKENIFQLSSNFFFKTRFFNKILIDMPEHFCQIEDYLCLEMMKMKVHRR